MSQLNTPEASWAAADGFRIILQDCTDALTPAQHTNYKMMYRQRVFMQTFPTLHEMLSSANEGILNTYFLSLMICRYRLKIVMS